MSDSSDSEPEVVTFTGTASSSSEPMSKRERKLFMTSTAPKKEIKEPPKSRKKKDVDPESVENDLALQRLISESHILAEANDYTGADISLDFDPIGKSRIKALDSRMHTLTGKTQKAQKMPMKMRQGVEAKRKERQDKKEKEAREAGIVLARKAKVKKSTTKRDRGLKIASVGKSTGHGIVVSERDIQRIRNKK